MPSSPSFSVATPCMVLQPVDSPESSGRPEWLCPSTKPGQRMPPSRSTVRRESSLVVRGSTAAMNPSCTLTEPQNHGVPVPSTIRALQKSVSTWDASLKEGETARSGGGAAPEPGPARPAGNCGGGPCGGYPTARRSAPASEGPDVQITYLGGDGVRYGGAPDVPSPPTSRDSLPMMMLLNTRALPISTAMGVAGRTWSAAQRSRMVFRMPSTAGYSACPN